MRAPVTGIYARRAHAVPVVARGQQDQEILYIKYILLCLCDQQIHQWEAEHVNDDHTTTDRSEFFWGGLSIERCGVWP